MNITSQLLGGLGNMLFATATAYSFSKQFNLNQVLSLNHLGALHTPPDKYTNNIFRKIEIAENTHGYKVVNEPSFTYSKFTIPTDTDTKLFGYFQSEKYFAKYRNEILDLFSPTEEILNNIHDNYGELYQNKTVSLHVRRGNYVNLSAIHPPITVEYCYQALKCFPNHTVLVFSDDIEYCKKIFTDKNFCFIQNTADITDLYMMSLCDNNIIANSTFSWWGAWLNKKNNKVICPSKWFGPNRYDDRDIIPSSWIKI